MANFTIEMEDYYLPIQTEKSTKERANVVHRYYGCVECDTPTEKKNFCPKCEKEVGTHLVGEKEEVGSRDMWDYRRVPMTNVDIQRVYSWDNIKSGNITKKPKASEIAKHKEQMSKIGKSKTLKDLYVDLIIHREVLECNVVFNGRQNKAWIMPYPFMNRQKNLLLAVANGNLEVIEPTETFEELKLEEAIKIKG